MKYKWNLLLFLIVTMLEAIAANIAHPVTPQLIKQNQMPNFAFGLVFAAMALGNFVFSPFWGQLSRKVGNLKLIFIGVLGYALGQYLFGISTNVYFATFARFISGFFVSAVTVCQLTYLTIISNEGKASKNLVLMTSLVGVFGTFGYLIGGYIGNFNISNAFNLQVALLVVVAFAYLSIYYLFKEKPLSITIDVIELFKSLNPLRPFMNKTKKLELSIVFILTSAIFVNFAITAYEQTFNFYINDIMSFTPFQNGLLKSTAGILSLIVNLTIGMWMLRKAKVNKSLNVVIFASAFAVGLVFVFSNPIMLVLFNLIYFMITSLIIPLMQAQIVEEVKVENRGEVMGYYNSMRFLGVIVGSLVAGFVYELNPMIPFMLTFIMFVIAGILGIVQLKSRR